MTLPLPRRIRAHGRRSLFVVDVVLAAGLGLAQPAGAASAPVGSVSSGVWPLEPPQVVRRFDPPDAPWGAGHRGVDLAGTVGEVVRAALAGRIAFAGSLAGRGVVVVDHGDTRTTYEPVLAQVRVGDSVAGGQPIGRLELADSHCFPAACLHWGWKRGKQYLDPLLLVGGGPIVLLPPAGVPTVVALPPAQPLPRRAPIEPVASPRRPAPVWRRPLAMRPLLW
jgi:murein DD-endopeptidase MepM/ murein hydrolase activator NlpD